MYTWQGHGRNIWAASHEKVPNGLSRYHGTTKTFTEKMINKENKLRECSFIIGGGDGSKMGGLGKIDEDRRCRIVQILYLIFFISILAFIQLVDYIHTYNTVNYLSINQEASSYWLSIDSLYLLITD